MVIDCHCHVGLGDGLTGPWDTRAALGNYIRRAQRAGIRRTIVFSVFHSDYRVANREVARQVAANRDRLLGFAFVHAERDRGRIASMVTQAVNEWGFCGIKVHRRDAALTREVCDVACHFRVPILYDPMGDVRALALLSDEYPNVSFVVAHFGSFADDWWVQRSVIDLMVRHRNIYADTAGVRRFDVLVEAVKRVGPTRILFGSDGPFLHPGLELQKVKLLGLPRAAEARILGGNAAELVRPHCQLWKTDAIHQLGSHQGGDRDHKRHLDS